MDSTWSDSQVCRLFPKMSRPEIIKDDSRPAVPSVTDAPWTIEYLPVRLLAVKCMCYLYVLNIGVHVCMYMYDRIQHLA